MKRQRDDLARQKDKNKTREQENISTRPYEMFLFHIQKSKILYCQNCQVSHLQESDDSKCRLDFVDLLLCELKCTVQSILGICQVVYGNAF